MVLKSLNHKIIFGFFESTSDFKKYVFINARKQTRQKMEGISAGQL